MQEIVVIDGEIELENTLDGEVELEAITDLDPEVVLNTGGAVYPHYSGSYIVTPSSSVQTLDTSDKVMDDDVTVEAVPQGSATTPATIITADPTISVSSGGLITAQVNKTQQVTPTVQEGYVEEGTPGNVGVSGSNTEQLSVQGAQTIHPASTDQSIASGKYLTGAQTIQKVVVDGLTADKIVNGHTVKIGDVDDDDRIMSVTGTASGGGKVTKTLTNILGNSTTLVTGYLANNGSISSQGSTPKEVTTDYINISAYQGQSVYFFVKTGGNVMPWSAHLFYDSNQGTIGSRGTPFGTQSSNSFGTGAGMVFYGSGKGALGSSSSVSIPSTAVYIRVSFRTGGAGGLSVVLASEIDPADYFSRDIDEIAFVNEIESDGSAT